MTSKHEKHLGRALALALVLALASAVPAYARPDPEYGTFNDSVVAESTLRDDIVGYAYSFVGVTPYVAGNYSLWGGTDCSGFLWLIYGTFGISVYPGTAAYDGYAFGQRVSLDKLLPGDIVVYGYLDHVAIYAGNGYIIHCSSAVGCVTVSSLWYRNDPAYGIRVIGV